MVLVAAVSAGIAARLAPIFVMPVVVLEILLGIVIGPEVLGLSPDDDFMDFFASLGLGFLFFFAGYEIEFRHIKGLPLRLAGQGWALSLLLAFSIGGVLAVFGVGAALLYSGAAMATTAIGTLIPILRDAGEMHTRFGTFLLAAGAMGEFGPIMLVTLFFSSRALGANTAILILFTLVSLGAAWVATRSVGRGWNLLERTLESSSQFAVRIVVLIVFALAALAAELGLDLLLGGFVAGIIVSLAFRDRETEVVESKLNAVGYGFLIPFFFVYTGVSFDLSSLLEEPLRFLEVPLFTALFLLVRGVPALLLYREVLPVLRDRIALAVFTATELPLVVAITTIAVDRGEMSSGVAASLVGAAVLSTAVFPLIGLRLRAGAEKAPVPVPA